MANVGAAVASESSEDFNHAPAFLHLSQKIKNLGVLLDQTYAKSFEYPEDLPTLERILGGEWSRLRDPWGQPLTAEFGLERENFVITLRSAGPDKKRGTDDDFIVGTFRAIVLYTAPPGSSNEP